MLMRLNNVLCVSHAIAFPLQCCITLVMRLLFLIAYYCSVVVLSCMNYPSIIIMIKYNIFIVPYSHRVLYGAEQHRFLNFIKIYSF